MRAISKKSIKQRLKKIGLLEDAQILLIGQDELVDGISLERIDRMEILVEMCLKRKIDEETEHQLRKCLAQIGKLYTRDSNYKKVLTQMGKDWMQVDKTLHKAEFEIEWGVL